MTPALRYYGLNFVLSAAFLRALVLLRLETAMSLLAIWWGVLTLLFDDFWHAWTVTQRFAELTYGHPSVMSYALLLAGLIGLLGTLRKWRKVRALSSAAAFICWAVLTVAFLTNVPIASPGVACYSAFSMIELITFVGSYIDIDSYAAQIRDLPNIIAAAPQDGRNGVS